MRFKKGVKLQGVRPELVLAMQVANDIFAGERCEMTITSVLDGEHSRNSLHYAGCAFDVRTRGIHGSTVNRIEATLRGALTVDFDVVLESTHLHIEYQPRFANNG